MIGRLLREPLVHFLALGGLLFIGFSVLNEDLPETPKEIRVTAQVIEGLTQSFEAAWRRPPSATERAALIEAHIRQEVLVREAQALGLDRNDAVIRQRLQQKMDFLLSSSANALTPTDADLSGFLQEHADRFRIPGQVAFQQVYLGQTVELGAVDAAIDKLNTGTPPQTLAQSSLLPVTLPLTSVQAVDATFGPGVGETLTEVPLHQWVGPVISGYGVHVVLVSERTDPVLPDLSLIRDKVEAGWRETRAEEMAETLYQDLRDGFDIQVETMGEDAVE